MDYKKIIKKRSIRLKILSFFDWLSDEYMLKLQYYIKMGRLLDIKNPRRFSEKLQWYKLNYKDPLMAVCADKYDVRDYVAKKGLSHILIECYGVFDDLKSIDFSILPEEYVMKDTLGSGGDSVIIVDKNHRYSMQYLKDKCKEWLDIGLVRVDPGREWIYCKKKHRVIFEKKLDVDQQGDLLDYKFFCFSGKCKYIYVIGERKLGRGAGLAIFDNKFNRLNVLRKDEFRLNRSVARPSNLDNMIEVAETLADGFPEVRVDLYNVRGNVYFGEMTFFDGSGYMKYEPDSFDYDIGKCFDIDNVPITK